MLSLTHSLCLAAALLSAAATGAAAQRYQQQEERAPRYIAETADGNRAVVTPVPILKQVNRHNEDGSYTYGYEAADGSFKIETKLANGEVKGKYGYRDDTGKVRTVEYGANKYGFQPSGEGITVAAPTLVDDSAATAEQPARPSSQFGSGGDGGRGQYRPAPQPAPASADYDYEEPAPYRAPAPAPAYRAPAPAPAARLHTAAIVAAPRPPKPAFFAGAVPAPAPAPAPVRDDSAYFRPSSAPAAPAASPLGHYSQDIDFGSQQSQPQNQFFSPAAAPTPHKQYPAQQYSARQQYQPAPAQQEYQPSPQQYQPSPQQYQPAPQQYRQASAQPAREPFSRLDELIKQYGLPAGGSPALHDITFGSY